MIPYEKGQLEKAAKEILKIESEMHSWITEIKRVQDKCGIVRQMIYNSINHDKFKDDED